MVALHWALAPAIAEEMFGPGNVEVETYGNVLTATASSMGSPLPICGPTRSR